MKSAFVLAVFLAFGTAVAESGNNSGKTLAELIEMSQKNHPQVAVGRWEVKAAEFDQARVDGEFAPRIKARAGVGPITEVTGDALTSVQDRDHFGAAYLASLEFTWPIYTFGRRDALERAARLGAAVKQSEAEETENQLVFEVKEAYFGELFAKNMVDFIEGHQETLDGILGRMREDKKKKNEVFRLEVLLSQLRIKLAEARAALATARMGLALRTGHALDETVPLKEQWLAARSRKKQELADYLQRLGGRHPKLKMLAAGIEAKAALARSEDRARWPVFALLGKYDYSSASVREDQQSVFAYDPYNRSDLTVGIGFEWNFQFSLQGAKRDKYLAEKEKLEVQKVLAEGGLAGLVAKAWFELERAEEQLDAAKEGNKSAKKLWNRSAMSWAAGLASSEEISQAFTTRALATKDYYEAVFAYEMAWAALSRAVGQEVDPLLTAPKQRL